MSEEKNFAVINAENAERAGRIVPLGEIESTSVLAVMELWNELRGPRQFPSRTEITPRRFAKYLRFITLFEVLDDGADIEFRVMGDAAVVAFGGTFHGKRKDSLNQLQPGFGDVMARVCGHVVRTRTMLPVKGWFQQSKGDAFYQEAIFFPLGENEAIVDHILCVGNYTPAPPEQISG
jgi:hypothetical protein